MDFMTDQFPGKEYNNRSKGKGQKPGFKERVHLRGREAGGEKKKRKFVSNKVWDK